MTIYGLITRVIWFFETFRSVCFCHTTSVYFNVRVTLFIVLYMFEVIFLFTVAYFLFGVFVCVMNFGWQNRREQALLVVDIHFTFCTSVTVLVCFWLVRFQICHVVNLGKFLSVATQGVCRFLCCVQHT